jgi:hypothetical protein
MHSDFERNNILRVVNRLSAESGYVAGRLFD